MNIVVLVKRVPDPEARVGVEGNALDVEEKFVMGFFEEIALEKALRIKEALGGRVTVITAGAPPSDEIVRKGIAMGADRAVRVELVEETRDPLTAARALAGAVKMCGADLVLCGKQSGDEEAGFTGPAVSALLEWPCVTGALTLEAAVEGGTGRREIEGGDEGFEVPWPAVVTAGRGLAEPRVPQIMGVMKAMKAPVEVLKPADVGLMEIEPLFEAASFRSPPRRGRVRMIEGEARDAARELVRVLKEEAKVL